MADEVLQSGYLHKFQQKIMRSWQKKWCVLSLSQQDDGKPAFHIYDSKEQVGKENTKRKTVYLDRSTCVGIVKNKHKEYYFEIITNDASTQGFAADSREDLDKWVLAMNNAASGVTGTARNIVILSKESTSVSDAPVSAAESSPSPSVYISEENMAYSSIEKISFIVTCRPTEKSKELELSGEYELILDCVKISLANVGADHVLYAWPYRYLRRYGRDRTLFSFEAGRKCKNVQGLFEFNTTEGNDIFYKIEDYVSRMKPMHDTTSTVTAPQHAKNSPTLGQPINRSLPPVPTPVLPPVPPNDSEAKDNTILRPRSTAEYANQSPKVRRQTDPLMKKPGQNQSPKDRKSMNPKPGPPIPPKPKLEKVNSVPMCRVVEQNEYSVAVEQQDRWQKCGRNINIHQEQLFDPKHEDYDIPKAGENFPHPPHSSEIYGDASTEEQQSETYDHLQLNPMKKKQSAAVGRQTLTYDTLEQLSNQSSIKVLTEDVEYDRVGGIDMEDQPVELEMDGEGYFTSQKCNTPPVASVSEPNQDIDDDVYATIVE